MFKLDQALDVHTNDIKDIMVRPGLRVTAGRDATIRVLDKDVLRVLSPRCGFVNSLAMTPQLGLYAGCQSGAIVFYSAFDAEPMQIAGHTANVCALDFRTQLLSGSWDHTLRKWDAERVVFSFTHPATVWACRYVTDTSFVSGCADTKIRIFRKETLQAEILCHLYYVRGLCVHKDIYSVSNEGLFVQNKLNGDLVRYAQYPSLMFSVYADDKFVVLCGDNGTVVINGQVISLPVATLWKVVVFDGKAYAAGSDGKVYVLRECAEGEAVETAQNVQAEQRSNDPDEHADDENVKKKVVNGKVYALVNNEWVVFGDVVHKFDHTFNVDVEGKTLELSFNDNENTFDIANRFLRQHKLDEQYRDDIIAFIKKNFAKKKPCHTYGDINREGVEKILKKHACDAVVANLASPSLADNAAVEKCLASLLCTEDRFAALDCYRFFVAKGFEFDFSFLAQFHAQSRKEAVVFVKLVTNLYAKQPFNLECVRPQIERIRDEKSVGDDVLDKYEANREACRK